MNVDPKWAEIFTDNPVVIIAGTLACGGLLIAHWLGAVPQAPWWAVWLCSAGLLFLGFVLALHALAACLERRDERGQRRNR